MVRRFAQMETLTLEQSGFTTAIDDALTAQLRTAHNDAIAQVCADTLIPKKAALSKPIYIPFLEVMAILKKFVETPQICLLGRERVLSDLRMHLQSREPGEDPVFEAIRVRIVRSGEGTLFFILQDVDKERLYGVLQCNWSV